MVELAANALTTVTTVEEDLGISAGAEPALARYINAASGAMERHCRRIFFRNTAIVETAKASGWDKLIVDRAPINSIASIVDNGSTVDSDSYSIDNAEAGLIARVNGWRWDAHYRNDVSQGPLAGTERALVVVTYDGGWYTPEQSKARGTITFTGQPANNETMVINNTTITAKTTGAAANEFNIGASVRVTCDNLVAAINAGSEAANVRAWRVGLTVVVEWLEPGTDGDTVIFTSALSNATLDGSGTLGGTQAGQTRGLPDDIEEACIELVRAIRAGKKRDPNVKAERLLSWSATYLGDTDSWPPAVRRTLDTYRRLT
jgi:hypothetical protein